MSIQAATDSQWDAMTCSSLVASAAHAVNHGGAVDVELHNEILDVDGIDLPELLHGLDVVDHETRATASRVEDAAIISEHGVVQLPDFLWHRWEDAQRQLEHIATLRAALSLARTA